MIIINYLKAYKKWEVHPQGLGTHKNYLFTSYSIFQIHFGLPSHSIYDRGSNIVNEKTIKHRPSP